MVSCLTQGSARQPGVALGISQREDFNSGPWKMVQFLKGGGGRVEARVGSAAADFQEI